MVGYWDGTIEKASKVEVPGISDTRSCTLDSPVANSPTLSEIRVVATLTALVLADKVSELLKGKELDG